MDIWSILGIIITVILAGLIIYGIWKWRSDGYELVEVDESDPAMKQLVESRNDLVNTVLTHLSVNLGLNPEEMDKLSKFTNISPEVSNLVIASEDTLITVVFHWDRYIKLILFRNAVDEDVVCRVSKKFWIRDNDINAAKFTRCIDKFKVKAYSDLLAGLEEQDFKSLALEAAKNILKTEDEDTIRKLIYKLILEFDPNDYKDNTNAMITYAGLLAYVLKFHNQEFQEIVKKKHI